MQVTCIKLGGNYTTHRTGKNTEKRRNHRNHQTIRAKTCPYTTGKGLANQAWYSIKPTITNGTLKGQINYTNQHTTNKRRYNEYNDPPGLRCKYLTHKTVNKRRENTEMSKNHRNQHTGKICVRQNLRYDRDDVREAIRTTRQRREKILHVVQNEKRGHENGIPDKKTRTTEIPNKWSKMGKTRAND